MDNDCDKNLLQVARSLRLQAGTLPRPDFCVPPDKDTLQRDSSPHLWEDETNGTHCPTPSTRDSADNYAEKSVSGKVLGSAQPTRFLHQTGAQRRGVTTCMTPNQTMHLIRKRLMLEWMNIAVTLLAFAALWWGLTARVTAKSDMEVLRRDLEDTDEDLREIMD